MIGLQTQTEVCDLRTAQERGKEERVLAGK